VQCKTPAEIKQLYGLFGVELLGVDLSDPHAIEDAVYISFRNTQIDILERISPFSRSELEQMVGSGDSCKIWPSQFRPIGDQNEVGHVFPQDYIFGVELTSRYFPSILDVDPSQQHNNHFSGAGNGPCKIDYVHLGIALEHIRKRIPHAEVFVTDLFH